jgi:hypothetical protein
MAELQIGDKVRIALPRGYSKRGVLGISVMYTTHPEARFEGALGEIVDINPRGLYSTPQYLVDFRQHQQENARLGIPWQAQWFREEWLAVETPAGVTVARPETGRRLSAEDSVSPVAAGTSPGGDDRTPQQEAEERRRLSGTAG